jgi:hypothetical protein
MDGLPLDPEMLWDELLSRQPERIREVFDSLDAPSQKIILAHLETMVRETGWHPEQRISARAALHALSNEK